MLSAQQMCYLAMYRHHIQIIQKLYTLYKMGFVEQD